MKLLVIDGNSILNRAYYGVKPLTTKDGRNTNALVGFLNIFRKLRTDEKPEAVAVAFDMRQPTFRHQMYSGYKAQRKGLPPELAEQMPVLKDLLTAMGIAQLECPGFEADDILGTLAAAAGEDDTCLLATGDRDSLQLCTKNVTVLLATTKETLRYTPETVLEEYRVKPVQCVELKGLQGDSSDSIPGVKGIGPKTAQDLIVQYGNLEGVYRAAEETDTIKANLRQKLLDEKDIAFLSRTLGTIRTDAPIDTDYKAYVPKPVNQAEMIQLLGSLEMFQMLERLQQDWKESPLYSLNTSVIAPAKSISLTTASSPNDLAEVIHQAKRADFLCRFDGNMLTELLFAVNGGVTRLGCGHPDFEGFCAAFCCDAAIQKTTAGTKRFFKWCVAKGFAPCAGFVLDTDLGGYLLDPGANAYDPLRLAAELGCETPGEGEPLVQQAAVLPELREKLLSVLNKNGLLNLLNEIELPLAAVLAEMELWGIQADSAAITEFGQKLEGQIAELEDVLVGLFGERINLNSPKQLSEMLFGNLGLQPPKKTKIGFSTNAETLEAMAEKHPAIPFILEYRTYSKLKSTYCDGLLKQISADGRVHSTFNQTETRTGRISSSDPNMQNIPVRTELGRELRRVFAAAPGWLLLDADYSQIELRIMAMLAGEESMLAAFASGADIHTATAAAVFGLPPHMITPMLRSRAKAVNFGIIYGIGGFSLAKDIGVSVREAQNYIDSYFTRYPKIKIFREGLIEQAKQDGFAVTAFGRRRLLPELKSANRQLREFGERVATNMPIQGTAADIIKLAMVRVAERLRREGLQARLILQVHDELLVECPAVEELQASVILREEMEGAWTKTPLLAEVHSGTNWLLAK